MESDTNAAPAPVFGPVPFLPRSGVGGQTITLHGENFDYPTVSVKFGEDTAADVVARSGRQITVNVPPGLTSAGTPKAVEITVTTAGGSVTAGLFTITG